MLSDEERKEFKEALTKWLEAQLTALLNGAQKIPFTENSKALVHGILAREIRAVMEEQNITLPMLLDEAGRLRAHGVIVAHDIPDCALLLCDGFEPVVYLDLEAEARRLVTFAMKPINACWHWRDEKGKVCERKLYDY